MGHRFGLVEDGFFIILLVLHLSYDKRQSQYTSDDHTHSLQRVPTFTARKRVVPLPVVSMQAGQHWVSNQHVTWVALKCNGLASAEVGVDDVTIWERKGILAVLELIC